MDNLHTHISAYVEKNFGITLHEHQLKRITNELNHLKDTLNMDNETIINGLKQENQIIKEAVIKATTVQESYFFRDQSLFNLLKEDYLPKLIQEKIKNNDYTLRIWSAGCARGEEIYSIAILLNELNLYTPPWKCQLIGTDINQAALNDATQGIYTKSSLRSLTQDYENRYFQKMNNHYLFNAQFKNKVNFTYYNFADNNFKNGFFDIIFCRNVFIYLSNAVIEQTLQLFFDSLLLHGRLFLGPSDFVSNTKHQFVTHFEKGVTFYTKKDEKPIEIKKTINITPSIPSPFLAHQADASSHLEKIRESIIKDPTHALHLIDQYLAIHKPTSLLYQYKAQALMNLNDIDTAFEFCNFALNLDKLNFYALLLQGMIYFEKNDFELAKKSFQKTLLIKSTSPEAYYFLAQIALAEKSEKKALLAFQQALTTAQKKDPNYILLGFEGESLEMFIKAVKHEIEMVEKKVINHE